MRRALLFIIIAACAIIHISAQTARLTGEIMRISRLAPRPAVGAIGGNDFIRICDTTDFWRREKLIVRTVLAGNVPDSLRYFHKLEFTTPVIDSIAILRRPHTVAIWVTCDYLAVGNNDDFVRMPMGPLAAQQIADSLDCVLPTPFLVDRINDVAQGAIDIFPFRPIGERNCQPFCFQDSNNAICALFRAKGYHFGQFISGLKKDIVLSCRTKDPRFRRNVAIYGWHRPDGSAVQPLYVRHVNFYTDYSHGVRLIHRIATIDGIDYDIRSILENPSLFRLLSSEEQPIIPATYAGDKPWHFDPQN